METIFSNSSLPPTLGLGGMILTLLSIITVDTIGP